MLNTNIFVSNIYSTCIYIDELDVYDVKYVCWIHKLQKMIVFCIIRCHPSNGNCDKVFCVCEYSLDEQIFRNEFEINGGIPNELVTDVFKHAVFIVNQNQDYVFIFGDDVTFILDLRNLKFMRCGISSPMTVQFETSFQAVCTSNREMDELIVDGCIRQFYNQKELQSLKLLPTYLVDIIKKFIWTEYIHLIRTLIGNQYDTTEPSNHIKINIEDLINHSEHAVNI